MRPEAIEQVEEFKRAFAATGSERVTTHIANINYLFALLEEERAALAAAEQRVAELERALRDLITAYDCECGIGDARQYADEVLAARTP